MRIAALDLGSNSFHLLVADARPGGHFEPLMRDKEMLQLGSVVARTGRIGDAGAAAAVETVRRFRALAESLGAEEMVAYATAAFRQAADADEVVAAMAAEAGVNVVVITGMEEARLVFEAISASVVIDPAPALALDLGGGSLEVMVGGPRELQWATSLDIGVGRLTAGVVAGGPFTKGDRKRIVATVEEAFAPIAHRVAALRPGMAVGSSGTLSALISLAAGRHGPAPSTLNHVAVTRRQLVTLTDDLLAMTSRQRAALPGVDSRRADLLPAGGLLVTTVLAIAGLDELVGCDWALREGMVLDAAGHRSGPAVTADPRAMRRQSVLDLCRRSGWNEVHGCKVSRLAVGLFDGTRSLHGMGDGERELLELGALLHDIGELVSGEGHERHTAYLIENGRLRGFSPEEIDVLACLGRFHKRGSPKQSFAPFGRLAGDGQARVSRLVALLQVADGLDRSHGGPVTSVEVSCHDRAVEVAAHAEGGIELELWFLRRKRTLFEKVFGRRLEVTDASLAVPA